ncbi:arginine--tRNA ligase [Paenibacillus antri]|uniref:Arginine--tRNA ligase n=1 Tax=Paenibacillus antri TaxID=2582848 RepID=A0A5R9G012_9BACL|nr:arginine--tRNA ligase [Paenibacillus antri]TLS49657.1 arginine--tRNA ligase [Paenibacillus antri]
MNALEQQKQKVTDALRQAAVKAGFVAEGEAPVITLEVPKEKAHGDLATNFAMQMTKTAKKPPRAIAEALLAALDGKAAGVERAEIAGPGFINLFMDKSYLREIVVQAVSQGDDYGRTDFGKGAKVQVEFVSANPTGSLHLGHARGAAVGDALCNVLDFAGFNVEREYYINDAGNQIANLAYSIEARYKQALGQEAAMPEDGYHGEDIVAFGRELAESKGDALLSLPDGERFAFFRQYGLERELDKIKRDLERFRVRFDHWFSETSIYADGLIEPTLAKLRENGHVFEHEGAVWLRTTPFGDDKDRVLIKNDGSYTYLLPDIAYHLNKYSRGYDRMINIWGADHHGYVPRMKAAMEALGEDPAKLTVLIAQMVSLYQGGEKVKMSKRTGKAVTMEDLMDEVGVDATRYFFAMRSTDSHLDFDMDLAVSQSNENPVFYVQYAHARICSVFRQAEEKGIAMPATAEGVDLSPLASEAAYDLLRKIGELPAEVAEAAESLAPHRVVRYVFELASQFHSYYKAERVLTEDEAETRAKLALFLALKHAFVNALRLIGVHAPDRM